MAETILITGASSGIGCATARYFAQKGWNVSATERNSASDSVWAHGGNLISPRLDVTDEASIASAIARTMERFGRIDVVVNNAGYGLFGPLEGTSAEQFEAAFRTNVFGAVNVIRQILPHMRQRGGGTIVNVSSVSGRFGSPFLSSYNAAKFALEGLSESLRFELQAHNVRVKVIEPGHFKSAFVTRGLEWVDHAAYEPQLANLKGWVRKSVVKAKDPSLVAAAIFDAVHDPADRLRYTVGGGLLTMKSLLPDAVWRWMMAMGMNRAPRGAVSSAADGSVEV